MPSLNNAKTRRRAKRTWIESSDGTVIEPDPTATSCGYGSRSNVGSAATPSAEATSDVTRTARAMKGRVFMAGFLWVYNPVRSTASIIANGLSTKNPSMWGDIKAFGQKPLIML